MRLMNVTRISKMHILPPAPDTCQECAVKHEPSLTHDNRSLYYQVTFYNKHKRYPTWDDAMAHCSPEVKQATVEVLTKNGLYKSEGKR